ncbi:tol-pal system YbgF family protein [Azospirillum rugosum]|uniref:Cytochrome c-type biogenesis protein CcmH/NrfG n=1 Tax=Azospirillum rugosum TaxID=416170 RepID=A0ABS4SK08_9PROT|nr:tetratricopeptide repeat protein [Azospirillum rugosum]MBP2292886.1 cytochrome c-type biogenesis protein CcmH/NrfG [Azospirillum rugosum]MDQ0529362.1 cytochrome c-type biogenesis protein CcmH/NrfG [Azospirillum rugosum]
MATVEEAIDIGLKHLDDGRLGDAEAVFQAVVNAVPDHATALYLLASVQAQSGKLDDAVRHMGLCVAANPTVVSFQCLLGDLFRALGRFDDAVRAYRRALAIDCATIQAVLGLAEAFRGARQPVEAAQAFRRALRLDPTRPDAIRGLSASLEALGQGREQARLLRLPVMLDPGSAEALTELGVAQLFCSHTAHAIRLLRCAAAVDPASERARYFLCLALWCGGYLTEACRRAPELLGVDDRYGGHLSALGVARYEQGYAEVIHITGCMAEPEREFPPTVVTAFCDPRKWALNWQLHSLFLSYLDLDCAALDFLVTIPPGTRHLIDPRIPCRIMEPVEGRYDHPNFAAVTTFEGTRYPYCNHYLAALDLPDGHRYALLTDVDTILMPAFKTFHPRRFAIGSGGYASEGSLRRLADFAQRRGFRYGRYRNLGPTWYGEAALLDRCARKSLEVASLLLEEDWRGMSWPDWWIGVLTMYASEVAINDLVDDLTLLDGVIEGHMPAGPGRGQEIHLHMWTPEDPMQHFGKASFDAGLYDGVQLEGLAGTALDYARRGVALARRTFS